MWVAWFTHVTNIMNVTEVIRSDDIQKIVVACEASITCILILYMFSEGREPSYLHVRLAVGKIRAPGVSLLMSRLGSPLAFYSFWWVQRELAPPVEAAVCLIDRPRWRCLTGLLALKMSCLKCTTKLNLDQNKQLPVGTAGVTILRARFRAAAFFFTNYKLEHWKTVFFYKNKFTQFWSLRKK